MNGATKNVVSLEIDVCNTANAIRQAREGGTMLHPNVDRDCAGTLHTNLCALMQQAHKLVADLEEYYGFSRGGR